RRARSRVAGMNRRCRSTNGHRAPRLVPASLTAPPPASRDQATSRAAAAARSRATCFAGGRTGPRSSPCFVIFGHQPVQQADAKTRSPTLIDLVLWRSHRRSRDVEVSPRRVVHKTLQELRGRDRATVATAGVLHVCKL